jgi:hypothetical protein
VASKRRQIFDAIKTQLTANLPWAKIVDWEKVRLLSSDFGDHEIPCVQFYHVRTPYEPARGQVQAKMLISVEVVMKSSYAGVVDQRDLFDKMDDVLLAFGKSINLGVPGVIHAQLLQDETDTHTISPHFLGTMTFEVTYLTIYGGC